MVIMVYVTIPLPSTFVNAVQDILAITVPQVSNQWTENRRFAQGKRTKKSNHIFLYSCFVKPLNLALSNINCDVDYCWRGGGGIHGVTYQCTGKKAHL